MEYMKIGCSDAGSLLVFLCKLDEEAEFMLYRPGERQANGHDLRGHIRALRFNSAILGAVDAGRIVGYLAIYGGRQSRNAHVATLSCGVLKEYQNRGVASALWHLIGECTDFMGITRIELSVVEKNVNAIKLYIKWGFVEEGYKFGSFLTDEGKYLSEVMMYRRV